MPKRKGLYGPTEFTCPDCQEMFDLEARSPLVGYCGHSLCAACLNEKEIKDCPECKMEGAFALKRRNNLAAGLLAALLKTKEYEFPAILDPKYRPFLAQIVKHLNPRSLLNLSQTCKDMRNICFNSWDIRIDYTFPEIGFFDRMNSFFVGPHIIPMNYGGDHHGLLGSVEKRKQLQKFPFVFKLETIFMVSPSIQVNAEVLSQLRSFLAEFPIKTVFKFNAERVIDWEAFVQFLKEFHTVDVQIEATLPGQNDIYDAVPSESLTYLLQNLIRFRSQMVISDSFILNASVKRLHLRNASISKETFVNLLKRFAHSTGDIQWTIGCPESFEFGHYDVFKVVGSFHDDEEDASEDLPLVKINAYIRGAFWILRKDRSRLKCYKSRGAVVFSTKEFDFDHESNDGFGDDQAIESDGLDDGASDSSEPYSDEDPGDF